MPIDAYTLCPGGTGKKIKFCCSDLLGELQTLYRMIEGEQYQASLNHIQRLRQTKPERACLLALHVFVLREMERWEEAKAVAAEFVQRHPDNPVALADHAWTTAVTEDGAAALRLLQQALARSTKTLEPTVYEAIGPVAQRLALEGEYLAGRALFTMQAQLNPDDPRAMQALVQLNAARHIPLFIKAQSRVSAPAEGPWKAEYEAARMASQMDWGRLASQLTGVAEKHGNPPALWKDIATLRAWSADRLGAVEAARKFAAMDVPVEDAAEMEAVAAFLSDDPLGDQIDVLALEYAIRDVEQLEVALASAPELVLSRGDLASMVEEGEVPPKSVYAFTDRAPLADGTGLTLASVPRVTATVMVFGKETDREARLVVPDVEAREVGLLKERLAALAGTALGELSVEEPIDRISQTLSMLRRKWRLPPGVTSPQVQQFLVEHDDDAILERWPKLALGLLGGKSADDASADWRLRPRVLGAILLLEYWHGSGGGHFDFNRLRSRLGLPTLEPIDPHQIVIRDLPITRMHRVMVEKLGDDGLVEGFQQAVAFAGVEAMGKLARELVERPSMAARPERISALSLLARMETDPARSLYYIEEGRKAGRAAGQSCALWDLMELGHRLSRHEIQEANRLFNHVQSHHLNEPGVADAVMRLLVEIGAIHPDGTPVGPPSAAAEAAPAIVVPGAESAQPDKLWVPDSQKPSEQKKIWVPGMD